MYCVVHACEMSRAGHSMEAGRTYGRWQERGIIADEYEVFLGVSQGVWNKTVVCNGTTP